MEYLHKKNAVHLDLKLENILVNEEMDVKIIDFGFATYNQSKLNAFGGTMSYMAPEIIQRQLYDGFKADIFSLGVILFTSVLLQSSLEQASTVSPNECETSNSISQLWHLYMYLGTTLRILERQRLRRKCRRCFVHQLQQQVDCSQQVRRPCF